MIKIISNCIMPIMVLIILLYAIKNNTNVYNSFIEGVKESFSIILSIFPSMLAMILGINILIKSDLLINLLKIMNPLFSILNIPFQVIPMAIMRPISGSASLAYLNNILSSYGPDSLIGYLSSIIQGSTDTTLYILTLYFGSIGIKKIKYALWVGLCADLIGIVSSIIIVRFLF